ncbi:hypothetical protein XENORESO_001420, partial [Xenotaenia resolanae]
MLTVKRCSDHSGCYIFCSLVLVLVLLPFRSTRAASGNKTSLLRFSLAFYNSARFTVPLFYIIHSSFNPVAPTTMMKVLKNILYTETEKQRHKSLYVPDKSELEMLCSGTSGDIRSAINSLQFCCLP